MTKISDIPLLPPEAMDYFTDSAEESLKTYLRATSIRNCLENIMDTVLIHLTDDGNKWKPGTKLGNKVKALSVILPPEIITPIKQIIKVGNKGAHQSEHKKLTLTEINESLENLSLICEWTLLHYFQKYGFEAQPWLPTIFSTLPPVYRVRILEELYRTEKTLLLVDKLAMAYLKAGDYEQSIRFICQCHDEGDITESFKNEMIEKMDLMLPHLDSFPIARNLSDTKDNFQKILEVVSEEDYSLFITIFTAVVAQDLLQERTALLNQNPANQRVDPTVKTPGESGNEQGTAGHP